MEDSDLFALQSHGDGNVVQGHNTAANEHPLMLSGNGVHHVHALHHGAKHRVAWVGSILVVQKSVVQ